MRNTFRKLRVAFSMIELVFVIVVLGIVASISSSTIVEIFKSYIPQKASALASEKTELAAMQIANRLSNSVPWSLTTTNNAGAEIQLKDAVASGDVINRSLEWIGIDNDSFSASNSWSGFCDTTNATATNCPTPGSNLAVPAGQAIIFKGIDYSPACMGMITADRTCVTTATASIGQNLGMNLPAGGQNITEHYVLANSAFSLTLPAASCIDRNGDGITECNLVLSYNYQPWNAAVQAPQTMVLLNNVTLFKFRQYADDTIRFKICVQQTIGDNNIAPITTCKEKTVIQ